MGYTHYFSPQKRIPDDGWEKIKTGVIELVRHLPEHTETAGGFHHNYPLKGAIEGITVDDKPVDLTPATAEAVVTQFDKDGKDIICFNGAERIGLDHETFVLQRFNKEPLGNFCKTARKPYDLLVCATLILADHYAPQCLDIGSDGGVDDWWPALEFVREHIDASVTIPEGVDPEHISKKGLKTQARVSEPLALLRDDVSVKKPDLFF